MSEPEATQAGEPPIDAPSAPAFDANAIRGLRAHVAADATAGVDDGARREALASELAARAARLAEAVDDSLVLANDGAIRWLGDPVAKLAAGEAPLAPRAVLLADDALSAESRAAAERRVSLWLAEHMRKVLGPLIGLADAEAITEPAREIALKVSQALGVLERERVKAQVKSLDQEARGALRKLGVRFGAHYIFVPALLKPSARTLCAHLWALSRPEGDGEGAAEKLLHFAASGRTSFAVEPPASAELYRVAGFRLCGERAVRVDIVERLTDLIRVALPRAPGSSDDADGFVVSNQMTSLTGCSGEHFASILRSLGFVAHAVKKSAYLAAAASRAASVAAPVQPSDAPAVAGEAAQASEPAAEAAAPEKAIATAEPDAILQSEPVAESAAPGEAEAQAEPEVQADAQSEAAAQAEPTPTTIPAAGEAPGEDEMIEVWRLAPRRPRHPPHHRHRGPPREAGAADANPPAQMRRPDDARPRKPWRGNKGAEGAPAQGGEAAKPERSGEARRGPPPWRREGGKGPGKTHGGGERRDDRRDRAGETGAKTDAQASAKPGAGAARPAGAEPRKPSVNLDSPFAKLLDLKPLLQSRDKSR
ncbi:MAG: hypothetical protein E7774_14700 [Bradyrhizobium sp.]|nr:MAG: hypothetical protein E7774_14700 [Bradyrhizobium sp.]